jgi:hypothetical protein
MSALIQHIKKVAIADTKLFFEPFVAVFHRTPVKH